LAAFIYPTESSTYKISKILIGVFGFLWITSHPHSKPFPESDPDPIANLPKKQEITGYFSLV
jgi:hypothetical protein